MTTTLLVSRRLVWWLAPASAFLLATCTPVSKLYEIHTPEMTCDEANRYVHDAVVRMGMTLTGFRLAHPGSPGYVRATRTDSRGTMNGDVTIRCEDDGVHIDATQAGIASQHEFERGVFLSVTSRADLVPERDGRKMGKLKKREPAARTVVPAAGGGGTHSAPAASTPYRYGDEQAAGVQVELEPVHGFATILDFEANLSEAGVLPVKVTITNATRRSYEFDSRDIILRRAGSRERAYSLTAREAVQRLHDKNRELIGSGRAQSASEIGPLGPTAASELGDVRAATEIIPARVLKAAYLRPGEQISGFLYFETGAYDRARITMIDAATGETEGFIVEF